MVSKAKTTKFTDWLIGPTVEDSPTAPTDPGDFGKVGEIVDWDYGAGETPDVDVSSQDSEVAENIPGLSTPGDVSLNMNFIGSDAQQQYLEESVDGGENPMRWFRLHTKNHATTPTMRTFKATVKTFRITGGTPGAFKASCTLKRSGAATKQHAPE